ncbi:MAG: hypothetical protein AVDCRST_MAG89-3733, partial [uncultured Gemmatimonadetes bacterium]
GGLGGVRGAGRLAHLHLRPCAHRGSAGHRPALLRAADAGQHPVPGVQPSAEEPHLRGGQRGSRRQRRRHAGGGADGPL